MTVMRRVRLNGARGVALLVGSAYCAVRGLAYLPAASPGDSLPDGLRLLSSFIPIAVWASAWLIVGVISLVCAFRRSDHIAWGLLVAMMTAWAIAYIVGWITSFGSPEGVSREWLSASTYGLPAIMIGLLSSRLVEPVGKEHLSHGDR
ncbi:hypothetical protein CH252_19205 [Rhodococcus sp. 06-1477-1B]|nr:hypothetical protein CH252_19205 [Rhodococcus sp. 06-1477-1B]